MLFRSLHKIRYRFFDRNIINKIDYVFAIGQESYRFYSELSCKWKVYPFIYCTEITNKSENHLFNDNVTKYIFVGSLDKRKNLICVLKAINDLKKYNITNFQLTIIGGGSELTRVKSYINKNNIQNIIFKGVLDNSKIANELSNNDILILPSLYDGWGAVINEALNEGLYIICSNMCGAKDLISNDSIGMIYDNNQNMHLSEKIIYACNNLDLIRENKKNRALWAKNKINGETLANYFTDCISGIEANAPWKSNV